MLLPRNGRYEYVKVAQEEVRIIIERSDLIKFQNAITIPPFCYCRFTMTFVDDPTDCYIESGTAMEKSSVHLDAGVR